MVRVHGGGWIGGGRGEAPAWNRWLNGRGMVVFDVDYRLPPPERSQDEVADVQSALRWVAAHATRCGADPDRISLMGHSAGGNLALLAAYRGATERQPPVRCVVNLYGPADLTDLWATSGSRRYVDSCLGSYLGGRPDEVPERYAAASPLRHVTAAAPPTLTVLGTSDRIVPAGQARRLAAALEDAGVYSETVLLPATDHAFDINWGGFATQVARTAIGDFLDRHA
jgi:acetyl esterase/lipase